MYNRLVWLVLEMTSLDPQTGTILEIACVITDNQLQIVYKAPVSIIKTDAKFLDAMHPDVHAMHADSGLLADLAHAHVSMQEAEQTLVAFLKQHCEPKTAPLCGNSIWMDKSFLKEHMPTLYAFFHYRTIDVSSIKELVRRWYPDDQRAVFVKHNNHRALQDVLESIRELQYYKDHFFMKVD